MAERKHRCKHVAVLLGGVSAEREISLRSGKAAAAALSRSGYEVDVVDVTTRALRLPVGIDTVFVALHGTFGEDGGVQKLLEQQGIPYTGSGVRASRMAMDKVLTKEAFLAAGVPTPDYVVCERGAHWKDFPLPAVVKPACQGSSIGVHRVDRFDEYQPALADAWQYDARVLVEAYVPGREVTVGILVDTPLPVVEIVSDGNWYGYQQKYLTDRTHYVVPADLPAACSRMLQEHAWQAFQHLGCEGSARVDFRLAPDGTPQALEVNTIPGLTEASLLPKAAAAAGVPFDRLCEQMVETARCGKPMDMGSGEGDSV